MTTSLLPGTAARPRPSHWLERRARTVVMGMLAGWTEGRLVIHEAGMHHAFGAATPDGLAANLEVRNARFWAEVAFGGSVGAAESYVRGDWECDDLTALVRMLARQRALLGGLDRGLAKLGAPLARIAHALHRNSRAGARRNVEAHYDLGNDFFATFLDPTLMYSCALFPTPTATLEIASQHKLDVICRRLRLEPGMELVEIGTGWGGFALHAAQRHGVRVVTTTISNEQHAAAVARVAAAGLQHRVTVLREDYRDLPRILGGRRFDRVVSIEMVEAVGAEFLGTYFGVLGRLLRDDGLGLLQAIVIRDQDEAEYRRRADFIQRSIFPGGELPSVRALVAAATTHSPLRVAGLDDWTPHYARTLALWRDRFHAARSQLDGLGFDATFQRMWHWYFCYCEGGFLERTIGLVHLHLAGPRAETGPLSAETVA